MGNNKKIVFILLSVLISSSALAEWTWVGGGGDGSDIYMDLESVRRDGEKVKLWTMQNFKPSSGKIKPKYLSNKSYWEFDCKQELARIPGITIYSGKKGSGSIVESDYNVNKAWLPVPPGTIGQMIFDAGCDETIGMNKWVLVETDNANVSLYSDYSSIRKVGDRVRMWQMLDFKSKDPNDGFSSKFHREYDCIEQQVRTIASLEYQANMGVGKKQLHNDATAWMPVEPGFNQMWQKACALAAIAQH